MGESHNELLEVDFTISIVVEDVDHTPGIKNQEWASAGEVVSKGELQDV